MRLRQLGKGQSIMYFAPPSVDQEIRRFRNKKATLPIEGRDVVSWTLEQTCQQLERNQPLRITQGLAYHDRQKKADTFLNPIGRGGDIIVEVPKPGDAKQFIEHEEQTLHDLYAPECLRNPKGTDLIAQSRLSDSPHVQQLIKEWDKLDLRKAAEASIHEEHEREIAREVEQEIQIQRPPRKSHATPIFDDRLHQLVSSGQVDEFRRFPSVNTTVLPRFSHLSSLRTPMIWNHLRASQGFLEVVKHDNKTIHLDDFFRPAKWVLASGKPSKAGDLLLISQYEANILYPSVSKPSSVVHLHSYDPRVANAMLAVDQNHADGKRTSTSAQRWRSSIPEHLRRGLHLFAGQLYINSHGEYEDWLAILDPPTDKAAGEEGLPRVGFWRAWFEMRRKDQDFLQSHVGQIVEGRALGEDIFQ